MLEVEKILDQYDLAPSIGVDEAGRGACAGPLVVAACVLPPGFNPANPPYSTINDSKKLTARQREKLFPIIIELALDYAIVEVSSQRIDEIGVHKANLEGMRQAVARISCETQFVLSDGFFIPGLQKPSQGIIKGDSAIMSIAAASILAKVYRDTLMNNYHAQYPQYDFPVHKGYATAKHQQALELHGPCPIHRFSYANVQAAKNSIYLKEMR